MRAKILLLFALGCAVSATAGHLTPEQALDRALNGNGQMRAKSLKARQLKRTNISAENVYVFTAADNSGFLITPADDRLRPVLGYADEGTIDPQNMSPELQWWLSEYDREIAALMPAEQATRIDADGLTPTPQTKSAVTDNYAQWSPIAPLVTSKWNQSAPYYDQCPLYGNISGNPRCVTGCVATAMAQVVYTNRYYNGSGSKSFYPWGTSYGTVSFDYANTAIDFSKMKDTYTSADSGTEAGNAVATLMLACGVGVEMNYGYNASGAVSADIAGALINHFGYSANGTCYIDRLGKTTDQFEATIYSELSNGRAMCYNGSSASGGHCFVVDGYDSNGMFHFNWGWGGMSDGYYVLTALNPGEQGIGSSEGGYNYRQGIICAAIPGSKNTVQEANGISGYLKYSGSTLYAYTCYTGESASKTIYSGLLIYDESGQLVKTHNFTSNTINSGYLKNNSLSSTSTFTSGLSAGKYKIVLNYRLSSTAEYKKITPYGGNPVVMTMTINGSGSRTYSNTTYDLKVAKTTEQRIYAATGGELNLAIINTGDDEVNTGVGVSLTNSNGSTTYYNITGASTTSDYWSYYLAFPVGQVRKIGFPISANSLSAGKYKLKLLGGNRTSISNDVIEFEVLSGSEEDYGGVELPGNWIITNSSSINDLVISGEQYYNALKIQSKSSNSNYVGISFAIYEKGTDNMLQSFHDGYWGLRNAQTYNISDMYSTAVNLPFGVYDIQYYVWPEGSDYLDYPATQRLNLRVGAQLGDYVIAPDKEGSGVCVVKSPSGNVEIPAAFTLSDGSSKATTEISEAIYQYNKELTGITLPSSLKKIGMFAFAGCPNLDYVVLNNPNPVFDYAPVIAQNSKSDCAWYVPRGSYDNYRDELKGNNLFEIPTALSGYEVYMDCGEEATLQSPFAQPGVYNYNVTNSKPAVANADTEFRIKGLTVGTNTVTVSTPAPFASSAELKVNVINPVDKPVASLAEMWSCLDNDELLPTVTPGVMRSSNHYIVGSDIHVFDRQSDYAMVNDRVFNDERLHGFKLTGLNSETDHTKALKISGRLVTENGLHSLRVTQATATDRKAEAAMQSIAFGTFDPATDAADWLHTYARLWCANYDATRGVLNGFSKARSGEASGLPVRNLNKVTLPSSSNRYDPVGYIDMDNNGNYFFVPTEDFGAISTGISKIDAEAAAGDDARYFNLQGIEVTGTPAPGLYIRKAADTTTKVVVR